jgi:predicted Zn-dependent protease
MHFYLAAVHLRLKQIPEATSEFDKTLELDANHFLANLKYGQMLLLEGDAAGALPKLTRAVKSNPDSAEAHDTLAGAYQALGQKEKAVREHALAGQSQRQPPE